MCTRLLLSDSRALLDRLCSFNAAPSSPPPLPSPCPDSYSCLAVPLHSRLSSGSRAAASSEGTQCPAPQVLSDPPLAHGWTLPFRCPAGRAWDGDAALDRHRTQCRSSPAICTPELWGARVPHLSTGGGAAFLPPAREGEGCPANSGLRTQSRARGPGDRLSSIRPPPGGPGPWGPGGKVMPLGASSSFRPRQSPRPQGHHPSPATWRVHLTTKTPLSEGPFHPPPPFPGPRRTRTSSPPQALPRSPCPQLPPLTVVTRVTVPSSPVPMAHTAHFTAGQEWSGDPRASEPPGWAGWAPPAEAPVPVTADPSCVSIRHHGSPRSPGLILTTVSPAALGPGPGGLSPSHGFSPSLLLSASSPHSSVPARGGHSPATQPRAPAQGPSARLHWARAHVAPRRRTVSSRDT